MSGQPSPGVDPSSFPALITGLGYQAQILLGVMPNPLSGKTEKDTSKAAVVINTLEMLKEKTAGNLADEEEKFLTTILTDLRMRFVQESKED